MKKIFLVTAFAIAISAAATVGASAQLTGPAGQDSMKTERMMNSNARMGHHRMHRMKMHKRHPMMRRHHMRRQHMMRGRM